MSAIKTSNDFTFAMEVAKAHGETDDNGQLTRMTIKGVASNTRRDKENHQFTLQGLESIKAAIENGIVDEDGEWQFVPLRSGHKSEWEDHLGSITKAEIDESENLWITAELDADSAKARELYVKVSKGNAVGRKPQLGLSVKGKTTKYHFGFDPVANTQVTYLDNLIIEEVSVTSKPKNPTPYPLAIAKSLTADPEYTQALEEHMTNLSQNIHDDPIAKAVQKAQEAQENASVVYTDGTEQSAAAEAQAANAADAQSVADDTQVTTAESEALQEEVAEGADKIVREDDVPAGYTTHPATHVEEEVAAQPEAQQEVSTEPAPSQEIAELTNLVREVLSRVEKLEQAPVEAQKAETVNETPASSVTLATPENVDEKVALAVAKAFSDLGLTSYAEDMKVMKAGIEAIQSQPNDRSISVSKAKDSEDANDPYVKMRTLKEKGFDPIRAAVQAAYDSSK